MASNETTIATFMINKVGGGGVRLFSACVYQILSLTNTEDFGLITVDKYFKPKRKH